MNEKTTETMLFRMPRERSTASEVLISVYESMREKGYDPINQIVEKPGIKISVRSAKSAYAAPGRSFKSLYENPAMDIEN